MSKFTGIRRLLSSIAALLALTGAAAAAETPDPKECAKAYAIAHDFRTQVRGIEAKDSKTTLRGLANYIDGFEAADFRSRVEDLAKKFPDKVESFFATTLDVSGIADALLMESAGGTLMALMTPEKVFAEQRKVFALARDCDVAHGFKPPLGEVPTAERAAAIIRGRIDREREANEKRLAALDDTECAIRFTLAGNLFPPRSPGQLSMMQGLQLAASKAMAQPGLTQERLMTLIQRGVTERAEKIKSGGYKPETLVEEVNACERRLGMPVSDLKLNSGG